MKKYSKLFFLVLLIAVFLISCNKNIVVINDEIDVSQNNNNNNTNTTKDKDKIVDKNKDKDKNIINEEEERRKLEEKRKIKLGEFYVPLPPLDNNNVNKKLPIKALFLTGHTAGMSVNKNNVENYSNYIIAKINSDFNKINELNPKIRKVNKFEKAIAIANTTEINAFVIDVKNDNGLMTYKSNIELTKLVNANRSTPIKDIKSLMEILDEYEIYPIARIVTFKDKNFANHLPEHSIQLKSGGIWKDYSGTAWVNPFDKYVWDYNLAIAKEAALLGFKEIQFDYVRFPDNAKYYNSVTNFPGRDGRDKDEAIEEFIKYVNSELKEYNVNISADVFGVITRSWDDKPEDIGQTWRKIARNVDVICPMIYPSHYGTGWYGFKYPDSNPYGVIKGALLEAIEKNASLKNAPQIRPWIQGFTASWVDGYIKYGYKQVREQIIAAKELGINEYLVWNAANSYDPLSFIATKEENNKISELLNNKPYELDLINRTPDKAVKEFLNAEKKNILSRLYLLTPINMRSNSFDEFKRFLNKSNLKLRNYKIISSELLNKDKALVTLSYTYYVKEKDQTINKTDSWIVIKENNIWKVVKPDIYKILDSSLKEKNNQVTE